MRSTRVVIVEDHQLVAEGLIALLGSYDQLDVVGWVPSATSALDVLDQWQPDVALVDLRLPVERGLDGVVAMRKHRPDVPIVFLSADDSDEAVSGAVEAGAVGYLLKSASGDQVVDAVRRAAAGQTLIPPERLAALLVRRGAIARERARLAQVANLTPREREVLVLLAEGLDNRTIADQLYVEYSTVRTHVRKVLRKLGARTRLEAVVRASRLGILP
jgi:DNA-binding NarL/FixJ family response regulator